jgi:phosphatidylserine/phosphatidylglycerophosphate/cardiolipin synthase-like enzyme
MASRSLIILPDDSAKPILDAIGNAKKSLRVKMFSFSDPALTKAVIDAHQRGVKVWVMLNAARRSGEDDNKGVRKALMKAGVAVNDSNPAFGITHEKSMVIDDALAFVKSLNWATENLTETRDYAIITDHKKGVREVLECFDADWHRKEFKPGLSAHMIWCPNDGRERLAYFIDKAKHTLFVQNERYQDPIIIERLVRAHERGVKIHLMARPPHTLKKAKLLEGVGGMRIMDDVGIKIHKLRHLKLHGKMLLADGLRAIVGSINLAPGSFDDRRELAIEFDDEDIVDRLHKIAHHDWKHSHPLDLSDEGLMSDLGDRVAGVAEKLVLTVEDPDEKKKKHKKKDHKKKK